MKESLDLNRWVLMVSEERHKGKKLVGGTIGEEVNTVGLGTMATAD